MRIWRYASWLSGLVLCLTGAALMFFRSRILVEETAGIAPIRVIVGIGLLSHAKRAELAPMTTGCDEQ